MAALRGLGLQEDRAALGAGALGQQGFREGPELHSAVLAARHQEGLLQPVAGFSGGETPAEPWPALLAEPHSSGLGPARKDCPTTRTTACPPPWPPLVTQSNKRSPAPAITQCPCTHWSRLLLGSRSPLGCPAPASVPHPWAGDSESKARAASASATPPALTTTWSNRWCPRCVCAQSPEPHKPPRRPCSSSRGECFDPGEAKGEGRLGGASPPVPAPQLLWCLTLAQLAKSRPFRNTSRARMMSGRKWSGRG